MTPPSADSPGGGRINPRGFCPECARRHAPGTGPARPPAHGPAHAQPAAPGIVRAVHLPLEGGAP